MEGETSSSEFLSPYRASSRCRLSKRGGKHRSNITVEKVRDLRVQWRRVHQTKMRAQREMEVSPLRRNTAFLILSLLAFVAWVSLMARVALALVAGFAGDEEEEGVEAWVLDQLQTPRPFLFAGIRALLALYFLLVFTLGLWESPRFRSLRPRPGHTSMRAIVGCVLLAAIASRGLAICGGILGVGRDVIEGWQSVEEDIMVVGQSQGLLSIFTGTGNASPGGGDAGGSVWGKGWVEALYRVGILVGASYSILDQTLLSRFHTALTAQPEEQSKGRASREGGEMESQGRSGVSPSLSSSERSISSISSRVRG